MLVATGSCLAIAAATEGSGTPSTPEVSPSAKEHAELVRRSWNGDPASQFKLAEQSSSPQVQRYWYCRSASQEHPLQTAAFFRLGSVHENGLGDQISAYSCYLLADGRGSQIAQSPMEELRKTLTEEQVAEAEQGASDWRPDNCGPIPDGVSTD
jgi:hypothetical protein